MRIKNVRVKKLKQLLALSLFSVPLPSQAVTVDLMVVYDSYSKQAFSNQPDTAIISWVDQINAVMQNSQVDVQVRLVGTVEHDVAGADMGAVLGNLRVDSVVAQKRSDLGADYVTMIDNTGNCGVGYVAVDKNYAFNVVGPQCGALAMAHELGHTMGLTHSRKQGDTSGARYVYGMGYGVDNSFATIMTYEYLFNAPKVAKYSNPNIQCNGMPCGVPEGYANSADAARAINNVSSEMASFYSTKVIDGGADSLGAGQTLYAGQSLVSKNGRYRLSMQTDGNLVIYNPSGAMWTSGTWKSDANKLVMQSDGNLVLSGPGGPRWASNTAKSSANSIIMQDDGNLVMYGPSGAVWASGTVFAGGAGTDLLNAGQTLNAGQSLVSPNGRYRLSMQTDGNLVIYNSSSPIWASGTWKSDANKLAMQTDGNLVVSGPGGPRWASNTSKTSANSVIMQDDGNLVMYGPTGAVWASGTKGK